MRQEIVATALISIALANGCKENRWVPRGRAELVRSEIKLRGADAVSRRLDSDEDFGRTVMDGIATGDSVWLDVARSLEPASATAEATLAIALAVALPHQPERVLTLVRNKYPTEEICGMPFLKADSAQVISYHGEADRALATVKDTSLRTIVTDCRTALDSSRSRRLERIDPGYVIKNKPAPAPRRRRR